MTIYTHTVDVLEFFTKASHVVGRYDYCVKVSHPFGYSPIVIKIRVTPYKTHSGCGKAIGKAKIQYDDSKPKSKRKWKIIDMDADLIINHYKEVLTESKDLNKNTLVKNR